MLVFRGLKEFFSGKLKGVMTDFFLKTKRSDAGYVWNPKEVMTDFFSKRSDVRDIKEVRTDFFFKKKDLMLSGYVGRLQGLSL